MSKEKAGNKLDSLFNLQFYKNQGNWKLRKGEANKNSGLCEQPVLKQVIEDEFPNQNLPAANTKPAVSNRLKQLLESYNNLKMETTGSVVSSEIDLDKTLMPSQSPSSTGQHYENPFGESYHQEDHHDAENDGEKKDGAKKKRKWVDLPVYLSESILEDIDTSNELDFESEEEEAQSASFELGFPGILEEAGMAPSPIFPQEAHTVPYEIDYPSAILEEVTVAPSAVFPGEAHDESFDLDFETFLEEARNVPSELVFSTPRGEAKEEPPVLRFSAFPEEALDTHLLSVPDPDYSDLSNMLARRLSLDLCRFSMKLYTVLHDERQAEAGTQDLGMMATEQTSTPKPVHEIMASSFIIPEIKTSNIVGRYRKRSYTL